MAEAHIIEVAHLMHQEAKRGEEMLDFLEHVPSDLTLLTPTLRPCLLKVPSYSSNAQIGTKASWDISHQK